jgi:hypothetical protein
MQRIYCGDPGGRPCSITPEGDMRYADGIIDKYRNRLICVCEDHTAAGREPVNTSIGIDLHGQEKDQVLVLSRCTEIKLRILILEQVHRL